MMKNSVGNEWRQSSRREMESRYEGRQGLITKAARVCFGRRGVAKTSIADITREVNITRELFYYYYPNKGAVIDAVTDVFVEDAQALLEQRLGELGAVEGVQEDEWEARERKLAVAIGALRTWLEADADAPVPMIDLLREMGQWPSVSYRAASQATTALIAEDVLSESDVEGVRIALVGVLTVIQYNPDIDDDSLARSVMPLLA